VAAASSLRRLQPTTPGQQPRPSQPWPISSWPPSYWRSLTGESFSLQRQRQRSGIIYAAAHLGTSLSGALSGWRQPAESSAAAISVSIHWPADILAGLATYGHNLVMK